MSIYIASPFFNQEELSNVLTVKNILQQRLECDIFVPMEHKIENAMSPPNEEWAKQVFEMDKTAIDNSDVIVLLYYGLYSDSGTAWECGYAYAMGKPVIVVRIDDRVDSMMVINGSHTILNGIEELEHYDFSAMKILKTKGEQK